MRNKDNKSAPSSGSCGPWTWKDCTWCQSL